MTVLVRYTDFGVPHVTGDTHSEVGFGAGWVNAEQHIGLLAERWVTLRGERSRFFGAREPVGSGPRPSTRNLESDLWWRKLAQDGVVSTAQRLAPPLGVRSEVADMVSGFAAGYNAYLAETGPDRLPDNRVRGQEWVRPISARDVYNQALHWNLFRSSGAMIPALISSPPGGGDPATPESTFAPPPQESNMVVVGRDMMAERAGMLFANPHWYWYGADSFREIHLTLPGAMDVYGSMVPGMPFVMTGFTQTLAYAGTSSFSQRFTLAHVRLSSTDPTVYQYDGSWRSMTSQSVTVPLEDGVREHVFWSTHHGPVIHSADHAWTATDAYAMRDVAMSIRWVNQQYSLMTASTLDEVDEETARYMAVGWRNLMAVDQVGSVLYADRTAVPHITDEQAREAERFPAAGEVWEEATPTVLDGTSAAAEWGSDGDAPVEGIFGASSLPTLRRTDYLANQNDTHWLNSPREPLEGFPTVLGLERTSRTLRTRFALTRLEQLRELSNASSDRIDFDSLRRAVFDSTVWSAVLWKQDVIDCATNDGSSILADAAQVLRDWDDTEQLGSRGAALWRSFFFELWTANEHIADELFVTPFDVARPLDTPAGLRGDRIIPALSRAVHSMAARALALDAPVDELQFIRRGTERLPLPGGPGSPGQYNLVENTNDFTTSIWPNELDYGTGFLLWVRLDADGPVAESVLTYSQVDDPASPHHRDQTELYRSGQAKPVRFREEDVARHTVRERRLPSPPDW
jgi:acyl-homoserine-lactone acylase